MFKTTIQCTHSKGYIFVPVSVNNEHFGTVLDTRAAELWLADARTKLRRVSKVESMLLLYDGRIVKQLSKFSIDSRSQKDDIERPKSELNHMQNHLT